MVRINNIRTCTVRYTQPERPELSILQMGKGSSILDRSCFSATWCYRTCCGPSEAAIGVMISNRTDVRPTLLPGIDRGRTRCKKNLGAIWSAGARGWSSRLAFRQEDQQMIISLGFCNINRSPAAPSRVIVGAMYARRLYNPPAIASIRRRR